MRVGVGVWARFRVWARVGVRVRVRVRVRSLPLRTCTQPLRPPGLCRIAAWKRP